MIVTVCNRDFEIRETATTTNNVVSIKFHTDIDGETHTLAAEYTTALADEFATLHNVSIEDTFREILKEDVRVEIFKVLKKTNIAELVQGKHPDLIYEWVRDFGTEDLTPEVQEQYIGVIAEAMKSDV